MANALKKQKNDANQSLLTRIERSTDGVSLIELVISVAILAALTLVISPSLLFYTERSRAQKDESAMDELTRAVRLSMVDQEIYDDTIVYNTRNNISCYIDSPTEVKYERIVQRTLSDGTEEYLFGDEARQLDEDLGMQQGI